MDSSLKGYSCSQAYDPLEFEDGNLKEISSVILYAMSDERASVFHKQALILNVYCQQNALVSSTM